MSITRHRRLAALPLAGAAIVGVALASPTTAHAAIAQAGTVSGDQSNGCDLNWHASAQLNSSLSGYDKSLITNDMGAQTTSDPLNNAAGQVNNVDNAHGGLSVLRYATPNDDGTYTVKEDVVITAGGVGTTGSDLSNLDIYVAPTQGLSTGVGDPITDGGAAAWSRVTDDANGDATNSQYHQAAATAVGAFPDDGVENGDRTFHINKLPAGQALVLEITQHEVSAANMAAGLTMSAVASSHDKATGSLDPSQCSVPAPSATQAQVNGNNNDQVTYTAPDGAVQVANTGWVNNKQVATYAMPYGQWFKTTDGGYVHAVNVTSTDKGVWQTKSTSTDPVIGTFAVKQYTPTTQAMVNTLAANNARHVLPYMYDTNGARNLASAYRRGTYGSLAGHFKVEYVTLTASDVAKYHGEAAAINAKTTTVANLGGSIRIGRTFTDAELLNSHATVGYPWTRTPSKPSWVATEQHQYTTVKVSAPIVTTTTITPAAATPVITVASLPAN